MKQFNKHVAHEIRNALLVIGANADLMKETKEYDETACTAIHIGMVRIATIINDLEGIGGEI